MVPIFFLHNVVLKFLRGEYKFLDPYLDDFSKLENIDFTLFSQIAPFNTFNIWLIKLVS
jgi:hypothetical protein